MGIAMVTLKRFFLFFICTSTLLYANCNLACEIAKLDIKAFVLHKIIDFKKYLSFIPGKDRIVTLSSIERSPFGQIEVSLGIGSKGEDVIVIKDLGDFDTIKKVIINDVGSIIDLGQTRSIYGKSLVSFNFFETGNMYVSYEKDGREYIARLKERESSIVDSSNLKPKKFDVVHQGSRISDNLNDTSNYALYTQISNKPFSVDVVSLDENVAALKNSKADIILELIDAKKSCDTAERLTVFRSSYGDRFFNDEFQKTMTGISYDKANRNVRFRIRHFDFDEFMTHNGISCTEDGHKRDGDIKGVPRCLNDFEKIKQYFPQCAFDDDGEERDICKPNKQAKNGKDGYRWECYECIMSINNPICSSDNFAIRPKELLIDVNGSIPNPMIAGVNYAVKIHAIDESNNPDKGYDQKRENINTKVIKYFRDGEVDESNALAGDWNITSPKNFVNGVLDANVSYSDVGEVKVVFSDSSWAAVDAKDAVVQPNALEINGTLRFRAIPHRFEFKTLTLSNHGKDYTYLSSDLNMSAKIEYELHALNALGEVTQNYGNRNSGFWEQNVTFANSLRYDGLNYDEKNATFKRMDNMDLDFKKGIATITAEKTGVTAEKKGVGVIEFNFTRDPKKPHEPFVLKGKDLNASNFKISVSDSDGVSGNRSAADGNITFYYAHLYAPDIRVSQKKVNAKLFVEVYCKDGSKGINCAGFGLDTPSVDRVNWWQFVKHQSGSGSLKKARSKQKDIRIEGAVQSVNLNKSLVKDKEDTLEVEYLGSKNTYKTKIELEPDSWLSYHKYIPFKDKDNEQNYFYIEWNLGAAGWAGVGELGQAVDDGSDNKGILRENHHRINW